MIKEIKIVGNRLFIVNEHKEKLVSLCFVLAVDFFSIDSHSIKPLYDGCLKNEFCSFLNSAGFCDGRHIDNNRMENVNLLELLQNE